MRLINLSRKGYLKWLNRDRKTFEVLKEANQACTNHRIGYSVYLVWCIFIGLFHLKISWTKV